MRNQEYRGHWRDERESERAGHHHEPAMSSIRMVSHAMR